MNNHSKQKIYRCFWQLIDFIYPPACAGCGHPGDILCDECFSKIDLITQPVCEKCGQPMKHAGICKECASDPPAFQASRSWAIYADPLREALHTFKYKNNLGLAQLFASHLAPVIQQNSWEIDFIIPVPLSPSHKKDRGYNQSEVLAYPLSLILNIPLLRNAVLRTKETKSQVKLKREERFKNVEDAFWGNPDKLKNKKVLLVDDIFTTGATLRSCSKAILEAGSETVFCATVAQTIR